ncbi:MAG: hypothetical protein GC171_03395 [Terrimonas sp.]|nr:hypothetical protein [Terrimonas sp.]
MRLVKSTTLKRINILALLITGFFFNINAQDNSPYSRYGLGDISPLTNILNRGMGGVSAAYSDLLSVNFNNPASYSAFRVNKVSGTGETLSGRIVLDAGVNFDSRTLREVNRVDKFTSPNTYFSYLQLGIPIKKGWGISFGLRPMTKISYRLQQNDRIAIDSIVTQYRGDGGTFLATTGTGFAIKNFSAGFNFGYLFGKKDYSTERTLISDSIAYARGNFETITSFGHIYLSGGLQQKFVFSKDKETKLDKSILRLGIYGNLKQDIKASQDLTRETFTRDQNSGYMKLDSVYSQKDIKGTIVYPSTLGMGFIYEKAASIKDRGWMLGVDYITTKWSDYRFFGATDLVKDSREIRLGAQLMPPIVGDITYWKNVSYRAGIFAGTDYIDASGKLPVLGVSAGIGLPVLNLKDPARRYKTQYTVVNLSFEYIKRGNNNNLLKENLFRFSLGFSLSDNWFEKRKYN